MFRSYAFAETTGRWLTAALGIVLLTGCTHARSAIMPPKTRPLTIDVEASADLNPDDSGRPSPVVVRIYQLASSDEFLTSEFSAVYRTDASTLGKSLLARQEVVALPGQSNSLTLEVASEARALGVLIAYRDIEHAHWRLVGTPGAAHLTLRLGAGTAQLQPHR